MSSFDEKFGFKVFAGDAKKWLILKNGAHLIGLFQGMFEKNFGAALYTVCQSV